MNKQDLKTSRELCYLLRHNNRDLNIDKFGYIFIEDIIKELNINISDLIRIIQEDDKQRYSIFENRVKANYGHSIKIENAYEPIQPPEFLLHGTSKRLLNSIKELGITKQKRQFVHLTDNYEDAVEVGKRHGEVVVLNINSGLMYIEGVEFYKSNNIYLTDYIDIKYIINLNED